MPNTKMVIGFSGKFKKQYHRKTPPKIQKSFDERSALFVTQPFHPLLNNHALKGKYLGFRSINITGNWRAIFREAERYSLVTFKTLGTHS